MSEAKQIAPGQSAASAAELETLLHGAGFSRLDAIGWIRVTGNDRVRWLNGMVTNSIHGLEPGQGNYSFVLNAQGRIQGDLTAFVGDAEDLLLETQQDRVTGMMDLFDRFIIMDEVELEDCSTGRVGFAVVGPGAEQLLGQLGFQAATNTRAVQAWRGAQVELIVAYAPLVPRFELWTDLQTAGKLEQALTDSAGGVVGPEAFESLRMLEGTPRFGVDIRDKELPQETMQARALHFAKGCYLGQEIVERIRSRGNVHRSFSGFRLEGPLPPAGTVLELDGKAVGELTSVVAVPLSEGVVHRALGYVRREALGPGARLAYAEGDGACWAIPTPLPVRLDAIPAGTSSIRTDRKESIHV